jgi:hypothetical protein
LPVGRMSRRDRPETRPVQGLHVRRPGWAHPEAEPED